MHDAYKNMFFIPHFPSLKGAKKVKISMLHSLMFTIN
jgi:hypothetical protein